MRRRPSNTIRVLGVCARCGIRPAAYHVRRVDEVLDVDGRPVRHQLVVCADCDRWHPADATRMEQDALAAVAGDPIAAQRFAAEWGAEIARVQRTAVLFLGAERAATLGAELRAEREAREARQLGDDAWRERWRQREWEDVAHG
jgi:hypothetical protein